ncbi:hypothetical protein CC1G_07273 [Coprinopsis cinerea okayama7|uniref:Uncharacterized protein n=1 Tax=Coprinopsis cinerea (strain Okayama-7 / 130 / ATCC MYA-4618 / FGSC 9003) TaxID=240176 RepID=A8PD63_COPC7|nr:hypothetical protein CC1G_07273 [Coprinopsis cinerea okayama7\|eukprot:XP_001840543.2 hypothetical protein CC1G_07273 [Coprinopsis cinerea okayama7\
MASTRDKQNARLGNEVRGAQHASQKSEPFVSKYALKRHKNKCTAVRKQTAGILERAKKYWDQKVAEMRTNLSANSTEFTDPTQAHTSSVSGEATAPIIDEPEPPLQPSRRRLYANGPNFTTAPDEFGLKKRFLYSEPPTHDPDAHATLMDRYDANNFAQVLTTEGDETDDAPRSSQPFGPYPNESSFNIGDWYWSQNTEKSEKDFKDLVSRLTSTTFLAGDLNNVKWKKVNTQLGSNKEEVPDGEGDWIDDDGWRTSSIEIQVPFNSHAREPGIETFKVGTLHHRSIVEALKEKLANKDSDRLFHYEPFELLWQPHPELPETRVFSDVYNSDAFLKAHREIQDPTKNPDCSLERVVVGLMFWSDQTHCTAFGTSKVWPLYMGFGNESKYRRSQPTSNLCEHVAYFESWSLILDDELVDAIENGVVITCCDGIRRRFYIRIFTYSADYPEKILIASIRRGHCPCPRCLTPLKNFHEMGTVEDKTFRRSNPRRFDERAYAGIVEARKAIYEKGVSAYGDKMHRDIMGEFHGLAPTKNAFISKLHRSGFDIGSALVVDLLHEFEIGVWKQLFNHLIRLLDSLGQGSMYVHELDRRRAARDFEDVLQWHALAKLRMHTEVTVSMLEETTTALGNQFRVFMNEVCSKVRTYELPHETEARLKRLKKRVAKEVEDKDDVDALDLPTSTPYAGTPTGPPSPTLSPHDADSHLPAIIVTPPQDPSMDIDPTPPIPLQNTNVAPSPPEEQPQRTGGKRRAADHGGPVTAKKARTSFEPRVTRSMTRAQSQNIGAVTNTTTTSTDTPITSNVNTSAPASSSNKVTDDRNEGGSTSTSKNASTTRGQGKTALKKAGNNRAAGSEKRTGKGKGKEVERVEGVVEAGKGVGKGRKGSKAIGIDAGNVLTDPGNEEGFQTEGELLHRSPKAWYRRTNKRRNGAYRHDPVCNNFIFKLKTFLRDRISETLPAYLSALFPNDSLPPGALRPLEWFQVPVSDNRIYSHKLLRVKYTTYDARIDEDLIHLGTDNHNIMVHNPDYQHGSGGHPYRYGKVIGIYHANFDLRSLVDPSIAHLVSDKPPLTTEFLWVRWYRHLPPQTSFHMDRLEFEELTEPDSTTFICPSNVIRACHIIPRFTIGPKYPAGHGGTSKFAGDEDDWNSYYVNRFADRDMFMRYWWGHAVGHRYARLDPTTIALENERIKSIAPKEVVAMDKAMVRDEDDDDDVASVASSTADDAYMAIDELDELASYGLRD